ncbi:MAB_1171c family putative transporter [Actinoplanes sp. NPDC049548]|uniref:MAB_1171c family putative transporter n=1 Tax=Actinoplanes sp. NPDC049548 TaxID=3155152 RepID=UPI003445BACA
MHDLVYGAGALASWIAFVYKMNHLRRDWANPALRAMCAAFGFSAVAFTLTVGPVYQPVDAALGVPNLTKLFVHAFMVLFSVFVLQLLAFWQWPARRARGRARGVMVLGLVVVAAMAALILLAPVHDRYTVDFWKTHAGRTSMLWYLTIFLVALSVGLVAITYRAWRFSGLAGPLPWLRRGLRLTTAGALVSFGYCACRGAYLILLGAGVRVDALVDIAMPFAGLGQVLFVAGLTMPSWGPQTRVDQLAAYRALEPLWSALRAAFPDIALHSPARGEAAAVGDLDYRLYRRMVEIWDGQLALRPYRAEAESEPGDADADAEARSILAALHCRADGAPPTGTGPAPGEVDGSLDWLVAVSRSYARIAPAHEAGAAV